MPRFAKYEENEEPISGYKLVDFLGAGQFGEVWKAVDTESGIFTAIKIIDLSHSSSALKELKALNLVRNLRHPNLVPIFTARLKDRNGKEHPLHKAEEVKQKGQLRELLIAMGLGDHSLSARLKQINPDGTDPADFKGIPVEELIPYMEGAARGIDYLNRKDHGLGKGQGDGPIIHCDIKPDNMMIVAGEVQIADCGVAVIITPDARQTKAAGSPAYSAPELTGNKPVPGTDQYALAISYYELRTGKLPFDESMGQLSIMLAHAEGRLDFSSPVLSEYEIRVLKWATAVQPKQRYASCMDMVKQLGRAQFDLPPLAPDQIGSKSGVVQVPLDRSKSGAIPKKPEPPKPKEKDKPTDEYRAPAGEDLRGTVIPDSDRMLPPSQAGFALPPADPGNGGSKAETKANSIRGTLMPDAGGPLAAKYDASQSEIMMPAAGDYTRDEDFDPDAAANTTADNAASRTVDRPQISVDRDDPLGAQHRTIELDDEIKKILRQNTPADPPLTGGPRLPSNPVIVPPVSPGKRSTQYPRETPPAEAEDDEPKSVPAWAREAEAEKVRAQTGEHAPASSSNNWKEAAPPPAKASGLPAKFIIGGVLVGGLAAGGFFLLGKKGADPQSSASNDGNGVVQVDPARIKAVDDQIAAKNWAEAEKLLAALPSDQAYTNERKRLEGEIKGGKAAGPKPGGVDPARIQEITVLIAKGDEDSLNRAETKRRELPSTTEYNIESANLAKEIREGREKLKQRVAAESIDKIKNHLMNPTVESLDAAEVLVPNLRGYFDGEAEKFTNQIAKDRESLGDLIFTKKLNALKGPAGELETTTESLQKEYLSDKGKQARIVQKLLAIGKMDEALRPAVLTILTKGKAFPTRVTAPADRKVCFSWKVVELNAPYDQAVTAVKALGAVDEPSAETVTAAQKGVTAFKTALAAVGTPFESAWAPDAVPEEMLKFQAVAETWSSARYRAAQEFGPFGEYFKASRLAEPPAPAAPFALEFLRLGAKRSLPIAALRDVRDRSKSWKNIAPEEQQRIDDLFQNALAFNIYEELAKPNPDWAKLKATADKDHAHGWAALAEAEQKFAANDPVATVLALIGEVEKHAATKDPTAAARATFVKYLRGVASRDLKAADDFAALFQPTTPDILNFPPRLKTAGEWLHDSATVVEKFKGTLGEVLDGNLKVYDPDQKALDRLIVADKLAGKSHPDWPLQLSLMAIACDRRDVANAAAGNVDLDKLPAGGKNEDLLAGLAFALTRTKTPGVIPSERAAAYAAAARLAIRAVEFDFDDCKTTGDTNTKQKSRYDRIQADIVQEGLKLSPVGRDRVSLEFSKLRTAPADQFKTPQDLVAALDRMADDVSANSPDRADFCSLRASTTFIRFSTRFDLGQSEDEPLREREWSRMLTDLDEALRRDPNNGPGNQYAAYATASEFGAYAAYSPPNNRKQKAGQYATNLAAAKKGVGYFDKAAASMSSRKFNVFWATRGAFLSECATDFARAGEPAADVKVMLEAAVEAATKADVQRGTPRYEDARILGRASEELAWLTGADPKKNYAAALTYLQLNRPPALPHEPQEGLIDRGRVTVRSVRYGAAPKADLAAAVPVLSDERLSPAGVADLVKDNRAVVAAAAARLPAKAQYWLGTLHRTAGDADKADDAYAKAIKAFADAGQSTPMHAWAYANRAENALDALDGRLKGSLDAAQVAGDAIKGLDGLLADNPTVFAPSMKYVPDYLRGRLALASGGPVAAAPHFQKAFDKLDAAMNDRLRSLRIEDPFAFHSLAIELDRCGVQLSAADKAKRLALLADLEKAFKWVMNDDDRKLVAQAKAK